MLLVILLKSANFNIGSSNKHLLESSGNEMSSPHS